MALGKFDYSIESLKVKSSTGEVLDIKDMVMSLSIYESISTPYIKVDVTVGDAANLIETVPFVGQEEVTLVLQEGGKRFTRKFYVASIENYVRANNQAAAYTLRLITPEQMFNALTLVSQSFSGTITDSMQAIVRDYLKSDIKVKELTSGNYNVVVPNWNPYQALDWLTARAIDGDKVPFAFYETFKDGLKLESYASIFKKPVYNKFIHKSGNAGKDDVDQLAASYNVAIEYDIRSYSNTYKQILRGVFGSSQHDVDISNRTYKHLTYDYREDFQKKPRLDKVPFINEQYKVDDKHIADYKSKAKVVNKNGFAFADSSSQNINNTFEFTNLEATPFIRQLELNKINMVVRGRTDLTPGTIIEFEVDKDKPMMHGNVKDYNEYLSGRYVVTNVHHKMANGKYNIIMDVARDSLGQEIKRRG